MPFNSDFCPYFGNTLTTFLPLHLPASFACLSSYLVIVLQFQTKPPIQSPKEDCSQSALHRGDNSRQSNSLFS